MTDLSDNNNSQTSNNILKFDTVDDQWKPLCRLAGISAYSQILMVVIIIALAAIFTISPAENAEEIFKMLESNKFQGILSLDFQSLIIICLMIPVFLGIFTVIRTKEPAYGSIITVFILIGVIMAITNHGGLSIINLFNKYTDAVSEEKERYLSAGEAVIATNEWHSTAWLIAGIFVQGGGVLISILMIKTNEFRYYTALFGIISNGLDLLQHLLHLIIPNISAYILYVAGIFYLLWYIYLGKDLHSYGSLV